MAIKTELQQAMLALHRARQQLVEFRTMQINGLRGMLAEFGEVMGLKRAGIVRAIPDVLARVADRLPAVLIDTLREQWKRILQLDKEVGEIERRMREWKKDDRAVKAISEIPGVGLLTATATVAMMGDAKAFKSAGSLRHGSDWCPSRLVRAERQICMESASEGMPICERC